MDNRKPWGIIVAALLCGGCVETEGEDNVREADIAAIHDLREREVAAAESGDLAALLSLRTEEFVAMPPGQPALEGMDAVRPFLTMMFDQVRLEETVVSEEVVVAGDWAYDRGTFSGTARPLSGGEAMPVGGKYLWIARRQADNSWKYAVQMWSDNQLP